MKTLFVFALLLVGCAKKSGGDAVVYAAATAPQPTATAEPIADGPLYKYEDGDAICYVYPHYGVSCISKKK